MSHLAAGPADLRLLCEEVQELSMRTGKFIREERKKVKRSDIEEKSFNNLVSYVDKTAEKMFVEGLKALLPEAGFISEEDASLPQSETLNWVIDPLDGTTNFLHGVPCFATSVGLVSGNEPVLGVIYEINLDECFYAWKNGGAWMNGERISVSETKQLSHSLVGTGFPYYDHAKLDNYIALFTELTKTTRGIRRPGSAATDIAYVACGRFDAFYEYGLHAWDVAAGAIIVREAGGIVSDFRGGNDFIHGKEFLCGTKDVHAQLLGMIRKYF
ncbi:MAG TPA: inositol monophosphatase family protein [Bacteroidia bacterium]|nr:inositol monophosphatase family protein [Bacteroidia bacterium]